MENCNPSDQNRRALAISLSCSGRGIHGEVDVATLKSEFARESVDHSPSAACGDSAGGGLKPDDPKTATDYRPDDPNGSHFLRLPNPLCSLGNLAEDVSRLKSKMDIRDRRRVAVSPVNRVKVHTLAAFSRSRWDPGAVGCGWYC
jgi:hypothetical protein